MTRYLSFFGRRLATLSSSTFKTLVMIDCYFDVFDIKLWCAAFTSFYIPLSFQKNPFLPLSSIISTDRSGTKIGGMVSLRSPVSPPPSVSSSTSCFLGSFFSFCCPPKPRNNYLIEQKRPTVFKASWQEVHPLPYLSSDTFPFLSFDTFWL